MIDLPDRLNSKMLLPELLMNTSMWSKRSKGINVTGISIVATIIVIIVWFLESSIKVMKIKLWYMGHFSCATAVVYNWGVSGHFGVLGHFG